MLLRCFSHLLRALGLNLTFFRRVVRLMLGGLLAASIKMQMQSQLKPMLLH